MISSLKGLVANKDPKSLVVEVGGIGLKVSAPTETLQKAARGKAISLFTHLVVREDALTLYGFADKETLEFFELLIGISGIGPKTAVAILNVASPETIRKAVASGDTSYLTKVSGIGKKTADRIVRELEDKIGVPEEGASISEEVDAVEAMRSLGYSQAEAREALKKVPQLVTGAGERIKAALKILGK
ncbi:MAG: Holliday junction branch migration protein RuvA [Patescibacteria group bacterium]